MNQYVDFTKQSPVILSLCPGIRGIERGLERIFREVRACAYVEIEAFIVENLLAAMEAGVVAPAPIWTNLKTFNPEPFRDRVDGIIGGYPCQPFSVAGARQGTEDPRHLWPFIREQVRVIRPGWCFFENVAGHLTLGFDIVKRELEEMGYFVEAGIYSAEEIGAPHRRERLFILAILADSSRDGGTGILRDLSYENASISEPEKQYKKESGESKYASEHAEELEHSESRGYGGLRNEISEREGHGATWRSSISRSAEELVDTSNFSTGGNNTRKSERAQMGVARNGILQCGWSKEEHFINPSSTELADSRLLRPQEYEQQTTGVEQRSKELADASIPRDEIGVSRQNERKEGFAGIANNNSTKHRFPAGQGVYQHEWEEPRTVESSVEYTINGYNFTEDLHRAIGNSVVEQTAELAFRDLWRKASEWYDFVVG